MKTPKTAQPIDLINNKAKLFPVIEIFGPTIQGEGALIGLQTVFVRFGGCDYRCSWCDTLYAVEPEQVRQLSTHMTAAEIVSQVEKLGPNVPWVTFSGGNPALHDLDEVVTALHEAGYFITVETQGTMWKSWLKDCDHVTVSPKPPSSGMVTDWDKLIPFYRLNKSTVKVVIFDEGDLDYAEQVTQRFPEWSMYLQVGNHVETDDLNSLVSRLEWLVGEVIKRPSLSHATVLPQLHVLIWGNKRGV